MFPKVKISLSVPGNNDADRKFSFRLKYDLDIEPCKYEKPANIFVVSDIEGNFQAFCRLLLKNRVINKYLQWTFETGHLVIVGDCFDRGESVMECLWLIYSLEEKAKRKGGYVHFILGNHEVMNINGDWRYIHPRYASKESIAGGKLTALYDGNSEIWRWLLTKNVIEKIGDVLFVHGGISPEMLNLNLSIDDINSLARSYLRSNGQSLHDSIVFSVFDSEASPFWYRGYYNQSVSESVIDHALLHFNAATIVTGHTLVVQVCSFYNGKVININTDHSIGNSQALLIKRGKYYRINSAGMRKKLK